MKKAIINNTQNIFFSAGKPNQINLVAVKTQTSANALSTNEWFCLVFMSKTFKAVYNRP